MFKQLGSVPLNQYYRNYTVYNMINIIKVVLILCTISRLSRMYAETKLNFVKYVGFWQSTF